jgi:eukaryotic-like serine/threonine-protein kinase
MQGIEMQPRNPDRDDGAGVETATRIGPYAILGSLGQGGMGAVYRARDVRLGRVVALKVLLDRWSLDPERIARFEREAQLLASLTHPHIATLYGLEDAAGRQCLVMELVEGDTLAERIGRGALPVSEALQVAAQIAAALDAAHEHGIVHRDLKPANVKITPDGTVKVLDFGLAKVVSGAAEADDPVDATVTGYGTHVGVVLGTAAYMSPEQARGQPVGKRTDIWAFGCVLYEMLTGRRPFTGETTTDTLSAILQREPDWDALPTSTPPAVRRLLRRCLDRDLRRRLHAIAHARLVLEDAIEEPAGWRTAATATSSGTLRRWQMIAALALAALAVLVVSSFSRSSRPPGIHPGFIQVTEQPGPELYPSLSPDGQSVVYAARTAGRWDLYLQRIGGTTAINLTSDSAADDTQPAFSPDGQRIAFRSERDGGGIFVSGATGESVRRIADEGFNPAWSPDGSAIVYSTLRFLQPDALFTYASHLAVADVTTGVSRTLTPEGVLPLQPHWSPSGHRIAYWAVAGGVRNIWTIPANGGAPVPVTQDVHLDWNPVWSADGRLLYFASDRGGSMNLWRVPLDERSGAVLGAPEPMTTPSPYSGFISVSRNGRRIGYVQQVRPVNVARVEFDPVREETVGPLVPLTQGLRVTSDPQFSPDGSRVSFYTWGQQEHIFSVRAHDGTDLQQLTSGSRERGGRWSPDGRRIAFFSARSGRYEIWSMNPDGGAVTQLTDFGCSQPPLWSPDGSRFVCHQFPTGLNPVVVRIGDPGRAEALVPWEGSDPFVASDWSPDGRRLAGALITPTGMNGLVLYSFDSGEYQPLTDFGRSPQWLGDSRRMIFQHRGSVYLADARDGRTREVFSVPPYEIDGFIGVSPDDRAIVFTLIAAEADIWLMDLP